MERMIEACKEKQSTDPRRIGQRHRLYRPKWRVDSVLQEKADKVPTKGGQRLGKTTKGGQRLGKTDQRLGNTDQGGQRLGKTDQKRTKSWKGLTKGGQRLGKTDQKQTKAWKGQTKGGRG